MKRALYNGVSGLMASARLAAEPLAPSDALRQVMTAIQAIVNSGRQVVVAAKRLVAKKEQRENEAMMASLNTGEPDLRRVNSMEPTRARTESSESTESTDKGEIRRMESTPALSQPAKKDVFDLSDDEDDVVVKKKSSNKLAKILGEAPPTSTANRKLSKFFGAESPAKEIAKPKPDYLLPDYKQSELVLNMESKVKGGTLPALIERLTQHDVVGLCPLFPRPLFFSILIFLSSR